MTVYKWVVQPCVASYGLSTQNTRDLSLFRCISPTSNIGILHIRNAQSSSYNRGIKGERERDVGLCYTAVLGFQWLRARIGFRLSWGAP